MKITIEVNVDRWPRRPKWPKGEKRVVIAVPAWPDNGESITDFVSGVERKINGQQMLLTWSRLNGKSGWAVTDPVSGMIISGEVHRTRHEALAAAEDSLTPANIAQMHRFWAHGGDGFPFNIVARMRSAAKKVGSLANQA